MTTTEEQKILCVGEALIDIVVREGEDPVEHVGGSILNVACGLAQLGYPTELVSWWAKDELGAMIEKHVEKMGLDVTEGTAGAERTTTALARLDAEGRATYEFDLTWKIPSIHDFSPFGHLHTGSLGATIQPGAKSVLKAVKQMSLEGTISYDPNCRPTLMEDPVQTRQQVEEIVALSDIVKASDEDINWLYPDTPVEKVMRQWLASGPGLVVCTRGPWGAYAMLAAERDMLVIDPLNIDLEDTVGAGDSFMSGLISALIDEDLAGSIEAKFNLRQARWGDVRPALHRATVTSGITASKAGAFSPSMEDVIRVFRADPKLR